MTKRKRQLLVAFALSTALLVLYVSGLASTGKPSLSMKTESFSVCVNALAFWNLAVLGPDAE